MGSPTRLNRLKITRTMKSSCFFYPPKITAAAVAVAAIPNIAGKNF